jgi:hypothetical protein
VSPSRRNHLLAAASLFLATAAFTLWQNSRVAVLWDISFLLDSSYRFSLGQLPYKTLPFSHAPLTFLLHTAIIRLFGRIYYPHILCAALEAGAATLVTWRILLKLLTSSQQASFSENERQAGGAGISASDGAWFLATILTVPLTILGIYGISPHPIYDSDTILAILLPLYLLQRSANRPSLSFLTGAACVLPLFFKQNIGLPFLLVTLAAVATIAITRRRQRISIVPQLWLVAGAAVTLSSALLILHATVGLQNYVYWTITFARQRRLPGFSVMLATYHQTSLVWSLPAAVSALILLRLSNRWARPVAILLLAAPFLWTIASLALTDDPSDRADQLLSLWPHLLLLGAAFALWNLRPANLHATSAFNAMLPVILLATIHGTFLSQQLWGSTYALWPLLTLLIASLLTQIPTIARPVATIIAATFLLCGGLYATSHERLSYVHLDGSLSHATLPELRGLTTPGPWIPAFEELVHVTDAEIPASDGILLLPGEDPFYFATGRAPQFPILLFDPATDPYTPEQTREEARACGIRWLIVNRDTQLTAPPHPNLSEITRTLQQDFTPYRSLTNYTIYRRK